MLYIGHENIITLSMPSFEQIAFKLLKQNKRQTNGHIYTLPSPQSYPYQWLWDSCFHAIVLSHFDLQWAKEELLSLTSKQFDNGLLPHMIFWQPGKRFQVVPGKKANINWGAKDTSSITQPPIIADAAFKIYQKDLDIKFLKKIYPSLKKFYSYLLSDRDVRGNHLIGLINPDESGEDNSPRFDISLGLPPTQSMMENFYQRLKLIEKNRLCDFETKTCMKNFFWVKDVPFNALMVKNLNTLSKIAQVLNKTGDERYFLRQSDLIKKAMRKYMYEDEIFWSLYDLSYKKIKVKTWAIFAPLYGQLLSKKEAEELIDDHLLNKNEFWLNFPVPTVARDEPTFNPEGFWRGPTWIATNWFIFQGLLNYGFLDIAKEVYRVSRYLVKKHGFREQFNPLTGAGLGAKNFTWGTLVVDMERSLRDH